VNKDNITPFMTTSRYQGTSSAQKVVTRPSGAIKAPPATTST
jgi:hypothetical protein